MAEPSADPLGVPPADDTPRPNVRKWPKPFPNSKGRRRVNAKEMDLPEEWQSEILSLHWIAEWHERRWGVHQRQLFDEGVTYALHSITNWRILEAYLVWCGLSQGMPKGKRPFVDDFSFLQVLKQIQLYQYTPRGGFQR